jgi:hypothetical protein
MADTAVINQLLAEAANRAVALAEQAQEAAGIVEDLQERAGSLAETLGEQGEEVHQRFQNCKRSSRPPTTSWRTGRCARNSLEALPEGLCRFRVGHQLGGDQGPALT